MASSCAVTASSSSLFLVLLFLASGGLAPPHLRVRAQQPYGSAIADCPNQHNASGLLGYFCGAGGAPSCPAFLTFNARPPYSTLASVAALLGADAAGLADGTRVLVPATCACTATPEGRFYQRNATYVVRPGDTLLIIANNTFQGLSSCQALQAQALRGAAPETLNASQPLPVPLRCACPTAAQAAAGARFLVSYLVAELDDVTAVAARFGVAVETIQEANRLQPPYTIFPYTTLLIPVSAQPNVSRIQTPPPPPPPPPVVAPLPGKKSGGHAGVYIGVAVAVAAVAAIASAGAVLAVKARRRRRAGAALDADDLAEKDGKGKGSDTNTTPSGFTGGGKFSLSTSEAFSSLSVTDIKSSLKVYTYAELRAATDDFSPDRRIGGGSVYRAAFHGDAAAVEVVDRDVSTEVEIMRKVNHLNLIRLVGLCHHHGRWYLVTEYAEHGALRDRLLAAGAGADLGAAGAGRARRRRGAPVPARVRTPAVRAHGREQRQRAPRRRRAPRQAPELRGRAGHHGRRRRRRRRSRGGGAVHDDKPHRGDARVHRAGVPGARRGVAQGRRVFARRGAPGARHGEGRRGAGGGRRGGPVRRAAGAGRGARRRRRRSAAEAGGAPGPGAAGGELPAGRRGHDGQAHREVRPARRRLPGRAPGRWRGAC